MPLYNFKSQFAGLVESLKKRQTIRPKRKRPTKIGDVLYLYTGHRTKKSRKIGEYICKSVDDIFIFRTNLEFYDFGVHLNGIKLFQDYISILIKKDGFENAHDFEKFFFSKADEFKGDLIKW